MDAGDAIVEQSRRPQRRRWWLGVAGVLAVAAVAVAMFDAATPASWPSELRWTVILPHDATEEQKVSIETYLRTLDTVRDIHFVTRDEAYQNFLIRFGHCGVGRKVRGQDWPRPADLSESFEFVSLTGDAGADDIVALDEHLYAEPTYATTGLPNLIPAESLTPSPQPCDLPSGRSED